MNCRVLMVKVPETFPGKWDLADELPKGFDGDHEALIALAKDVVFSCKLSTFRSSYC